MKSSRVFLEFWQVATQSIPIPNSWRWRHWHLPKRHQFSSRAVNNGQMTPLFCTHFRQDSGSRRRGALRRPGRGRPLSGPMSAEYAQVCMEGRARLRLSSAASSAAAEAAEERKELLKEGRKETLKRQKVTRERRKRRKRVRRTTTTTIL